MLSNVSKVNYNVIKLFEKTILKENRQILHEINSKGIEEAFSKRSFVKFAENTINYFSGSDFVQINLHDLGGNKFLSNNEKIISIKEANFSKNPLKFIFFKLDQLLLGSKIKSTGSHEAALGKVAEEMILSAAIDNSDPNATTVLIRTYIPIMDPENPIQVMCIVETITDITKLWDDITYLEKRISITFIIIFAIIFMIVIYNTHQAQKMIDKQYETTKVLEEAKNKAETENSEKSQFLANVSHELRTPLNAIIGFSEMIQSESHGPIDNEKYKDYINDINNSGKHLLSVINDILDFSKASADKLKVDNIEVDLNKIAVSSMRFVKPKADTGKINLVEIIPKEHIIINADPKRLKQALLNLLANAVKFTPENGTVTLELVKEDGIAYIMVKDTGIGIAEKDMHKALSSFGQLDHQHNRKYEGTGLGLPLTKKLVELMEGTFDIKSEVGKGTVVTISFKITNEINLT